MIVVENAASIKSTHLLNRTAEHIHDLDDDGLLLLADNYQRLGLLIPQRVHEELFNRGWRATPSFLIDEDFDD